MYLDANMVWTQSDLSHESFLIIVSCFLVLHISLQILLPEKEKNELVFLDREDFSSYGSGLNTKLSSPMKIETNKSRNSYLAQIIPRGGGTILHII